MDARLRACQSPSHGSPSHCCLNWVDARAVKKCIDWLSFHRKRVNHGQPLPYSPRVRSPTNNRCLIVGTTVSPQASQKFTRGGSKCKGCVVLGALRGQGGPSLHPCSDMCVLKQPAIPHPVPPRTHARTGAGGGCASSGKFCTHLRHKEYSDSCSLVMSTCSRPRHDGAEGHTNSTPIIDVGIHH
jgi:hypothetical protein